MAGIAELPTIHAAPEAHGPRARTRFAIAPRHVRALLWLRWKLTVRGYTRSRRQVIGLIFLLLYLVPISLLLGAGTALGYVLLPRAEAVQLLFLALALVYAAWAALPLVQFALNEGLDVTKLQHYPLTRGEQMASLVLSTLFDISTLFILALYAAVVVGWHATPLAALVTLGALALAYVHTVTLSQLVLAALMGLLRSRRYRDITIVVFALVGALASFAQIGFRSLHLGSPEGLFTGHLDTYLQWLPPGMAARAITLADQGRYVEALPWLAALVVLIPVLLALWARVLDRGITTAETNAGGSTRRPRRRAAPSAGAAGIPASISAARPGTVARRRRGLVSGPALAIARKDARYFWRDPQIKAMLLSSLGLLVIVFLPRLIGGPASNASGFSLQGSQVFFAPLPALVIVLNLSLNSLGLERQALQTLYLFPVRPLDILWGKNLAVGTLSLAAQVVLVVLAAALSGGWQYVPLALVAGVAAIFVMMGCGNVSAVLLPFRVRQMRIGTGNTSGEASFLRGLIGSVVFFATLLLLLPVALALALPLLLDHALWLAAALPLALLYGVALHQGASRLVAPLLLKRAPEILAVTAGEG